MFAYCIKTINWAETTLEKTEEANKNGQFRETGNAGYTRHKTKTNKAKNTTQYVLDTTIPKTKPHTNNVNKTWALI